MRKVSVMLSKKREKKHTTERNFRLNGERLLDWYRMK